MTRTKIDTDELEQIAATCVGRRIKVSNAYATPGSWAGTITNCELVGDDSFSFGVRCDEEGARTVSARDVETSITAGTITHRPDSSLVIVDQVASATIGPESPS